MTQVALQGQQPLSVQASYLGAALLGQPAATQEPSAISAIDGQFTNDQYPNVLHVASTFADSESTKGRVWERGSKALVDPLKAFGTHWNNAQDITDTKFGDETFDGRLNGWLQKFMFKPGSVGSWFVPKDYAHSDLSATEKASLGKWSANAEAAQSGVKFLFYLKSALNFRKSYRHAKDLKDPVERDSTRLDALGGMIYNQFLFIDKIGHMTGSVFYGMNNFFGALICIGLGRLSCLTSYAGAFIANGATTRKTLHASTMNALRAETKKVLDETNRVSAETRKALYKTMGSSHERAIVYARGALLAFFENERKIERPEVSKKEKILAFIKNRGKSERSKSLEKAEIPEHIQTSQRLFDELKAVQEKLGGELDTQARSDLRSKLQTAVDELRGSELTRCQDLAGILECATSFLDDAVDVSITARHSIEEKTLQLRQAVFDKAESTFNLLHENAIKIAQVSEPNRRSVMENVFFLRPLVERFTKPGSKQKIKQEVERLEAENKALLEELRLFSGERLYEIERLADKTTPEVADPDGEFFIDRAQRESELVHLMSPAQTEKKVTDVAAKAGADSRFGESLGKAIPFTMFFANGAYLYLSGQIDERKAIAVIKGSGTFYPWWVAGAIAVCTAMGSVGAFKTAGKEFIAENKKTDDLRSPARMLYYGALVFSTGLMITASIPAAHPVTRSLGIGIYALGVITEVAARFLPDLKKYAWYRRWSRKSFFEREVDLVSAEEAAARAAKLPANSNFDYHDTMLNDL